MMGFGVLGLALMVLFWIGLIFGAVWLIKVLFQGGTRNASGLQLDRPAGAREILDRRYAKGEINREEYDIYKRDLGL